MSLADRVRPETIHGHPCSVAKLIAKLEGEELAVFQRIMYGREGLTEPDRRYRGWTEREVFDVLEDEGYEVAKSQINIHRGKNCRCYRDAA